MDEIRRRLLSFAEEQWHTRRGLLAAIIIIVAMLIALFAGLNLRSISKLEWAAILIIAAVVVVVWFFTRLPRIPSGKIGIGLAVERDTTDETRRLYSDFVVSLRTSLRESGVEKKIELVELSQKLVDELDDPVRADWVARRTRVNMILYGRVRCRELRNGKTHIFDLRGLVRHTPIDKTRSVGIGSAIAESLPRRITLDADQEFLSCEFTAQLINIVTLYVIGTAAVFTDEYSQAEDILLDAERQLLGHLKQIQGVPLTVLLDRIQGRLRSLYEEWMTQFTSRYSRDRDRDHLRLAEEILAKLKKYDPQSYQGHLVSAMCAFVLRKDLEAAKREIAACENERDATWMYSRAFMEAYEGDLQKAYRTYSRAFRSPLASHTVPLVCEEFIQIVLEEEPTHTELYFCLALINLRAKDDTEAARRDLKRFLDSVTADRYKRQLDAAQEWLDEIESRSQAS